jgi:hypothetical protein
VNQGNEALHDKGASRSGGQRPGKLAWTDAVEMLAYLCPAGIVAWLFCYGSHHLIAFAALASLPWLSIGLVLLCPNRFSVTGGRFRGGEPKGLLGCWLMCFFVVTSMFRCVTTLKLSRIVLAGFLVGLVLSAVAYGADPILRDSRRRFSLFIIAVFSCLHGYMTIAGLNVLMDGSSPVVFSAVVSKRIAPLRGAKVLVVEPWGPERSVRKSRVSNRTYDSTVEHGQVSMVLYRGWLGFEWYTAQVHPWNGVRILLDPLQPE